VSSLSLVLIAWQYITGEADRRESRIASAWQVMNSAQAKSGNAGRIAALEQLAQDSADLSGVALTGAWIPKVQLAHVSLALARFDSAFAAGAILCGTDLREASLSKTVLWVADLSHADLRWANMASADLAGADLRGARLGQAQLTGTTFTAADLRGADLGLSNLRDARSFEGANIYGARTSWSKLRLDSLYGAVSIPNDSAWRIYRDSVLGEIEFTISLERFRPHPEVGSSCATHQSRRRASRFSDVFR
jgi:hypothetical protein